MDGGDILSHFPRTFAWMSRTPSQCTCFSVCSSHSHTCAWTVHDHSRYSQAVQNRGCYLTYGVHSQLYHFWLYGSYSNISLLLGSWRPPPKPPFLSLVGKSASVYASKKKKMDVKAKLTQKARVELCVSAWQTISSSFFCAFCLGYFHVFMAELGHSSGRAPQPFSTDVLLSQMPPQQHFNQQTSVIVFPSYESYIFCYLLSSTMKPMWVEQKDTGESQTLQSQY